MKDQIKMQYKKVTHVLFDMDGLILDTEDLYTIGFQKIASRFGKEFTFELKCKIMGQHGKEYAEIVVKDLELPISAEEFLEELKEILAQLFPQSKVLPGVKELIQHLHKNNIPIGLATSCGLDSFEIKTQRHKDLFKYFQSITCGTTDPEVKLGKPHPDIFLVAAAKFPDNPKPENCLVFEDSVNGVKAARAAGMQVVMVPDSRLDRAFASEATLVIDSMMNFKPELFGLPPLKH